MKKSNVTYHPGFKSVKEHEIPAPESDGIRTIREELGGGASEAGNEAASAPTHGDLWEPLMGRKTRRKGPATRAIIGNDDRIEVPNISEIPFSGICYLEIVPPDGGVTFVGTGWLISPTVVITAGHCVYCSPWKNGDEPETYGRGRAAAITACFGQRGNTSREKINAIAVEYPAEWQSNQQHREYDFAAIQLERPASSSFVPFVFGDGDDDFLKDMGVCIAGYPANTKKKSFNKTMYMHSGRIMGVEPQRLEYQIDTSAGDSGAALVYYDKEENTNVVVGIHNAGDSGAQLNIAARINSFVYSKLAEWQALGS